MKLLSLLLLCLLPNIAWANKLSVPKIVATQAQDITLGDIAIINVRNLKLEDKLRAIPLGQFLSNKKIKYLNGDIIKVRLDLMGINNIKLEIPHQITLVRDVAQMLQLEKTMEPPLAIVKYSKETEPSQVSTVKRRPRTVAKPAGVLRGIMLKTNVSAGELITANDLTYINFKYPRQGVLTNMADIIGKRALRSIRHKTLITADMVGVFDVVAGDRVRVQARRKGFVVESLATASQNGVAGETIIVSNPRTRQHFSAKVIGSGLVEVLF